MIFVISHMVPSDPVVANLSERNLNNNEMVEAFKIKWGLDKPLYIQYLLYMKSLLKGDLGMSIRTGRPVKDDISQFLPATIELAFSSMIFGLVFGISLGIISAIKQGSAIDQISRVISVTGISMPSFWFALVTLFVFYYKLDWAPGPGRISYFIEPPTIITNFYFLDSILQGNWLVAVDSLKHLILPSIVLGSFNMGLITRTTRSSLLEVLSSDYIRTAKAKGLTNGQVIIKHALRNALIPVITVVGLGLVSLLGGVVLVENIFAWPGIGKYAYQSVLSLDFPAISAVALLIAVSYIIVNTALDILYGVIDPRVKYY